ncbi:hypothetical protein SeMB42_g03927 [Synchytrium endobioticum]|uniref:Elongator complex protein 5 n=1 Tax=Synchytrium endobioticum TaxID=286115 RepID=A0A507D2X1_9FUNG|nr:hypothetical protein SeLEV6574_g04946 [Synchytrium endobioticum]TPX45651.1 hypothetical protein SeMB42_g03927 [Synchytrium endobioticum]
MRALLDVDDAVVHYGCVDVDPRRVAARLAYIPRLHLHDVNAHVYGLARTGTGLGAFRDAIAATRAAGARTIVVLDAVTTLCAVWPVALVAEFLAGLRDMGDVRVVAVHHAGIAVPGLVHPDTMLADLASTVLDVGDGCVDVVHARSVRRIVERWRYAVDADGIVRFEQEAGSDGAKKSAHVDPTSDLPFELNLTEEQRRARSEVNLPYMDAQGPGQVITGFEAEDDDDDPDFDLEI